MSTTYNTETVEASTLRKGDLVLGPRGWPERVTRTVHQRSGRIVVYVRSIFHQRRISARYFGAFQPTDTINKAVE